MTFEEWAATEAVLTGGEWLEIVDNAFGYIPKGVAAVHCYSPGVLVQLADGFYFTHIARREHAGTLEEVRRALWEEYAERETRS